MADVSAYDPVFEAAGNEWNVDPQLLKAMAIQESGGRANLVSSKGALGVMQIMPETAKTLGITDPTDPVQSIYGAAKYMNRALDKEGSVEDALRNYHGGDGWRQAYGDESRKYVPAVTKHYQILGQFKAALADPDPSVRTDATAADAPAPAAPTGAGKAMASADPLSLLPPAPKPSTGSAATTVPDDPLSLLPPAPKPAGTASTTTTQETAPPSFTDAYAHTQSVDEYGNVQTPLAAAPTPPSSLEDLRAQIQAGETNALRRLASGPETGPVEDFARHAAGTGVALLSQAAQLPVNILMGITGGASTRNLTINPDTGTLNLTPEALTAAQVLTGGGPAGRDIRFVPRGGNPLEFVPPARSGGPLPPDTAANLLSPDAKARTAETPAGPTSPTGIEPPPSPPPPPTTGGGAAGAQVTPGYEAIHTPAEEATYRATAEGKKLLEPQIIGERDVNQYIPGETVNNAEREQTVKTARELKELGIRVPEASQMDKAAAESNNTARTIYLDNTTKGPVEIANERVARQTDIEADKAKVFAPDNVTGPVDLKPVIDHMEAVLDQPFNRQNTALQQAYRPWLERMKAVPDGVIQDPEEAWGLRYDIDQQTDKFAQRDNPNMHRVANRLNDAAGAIDEQIEKVAPGYADMLAKYKEHSRAIDEMEVLQGAKDKFRGPGQKLTYNDFQRYMKNVVDSRMTPSTDLNGFKAISDENMQRLWNIRDSLRRTASAQELAKAAGSDTMPNIIDALKAVGKMGGTTALHTYAFSHLGPGGNFALQSLGQIGRTLNERRGIRRGMRQMQNLLRPSEPLRVPPGQENPLTGAPPP